MVDYMVVVTYVLFAVNAGVVGLLAFAVHDLIRSILNPERLGISSAKEFQTNRMFNALLYKHSGYLYYGFGACLIVDAGYFVCYMYFDKPITFPLFSTGSVLVIISIGTVTAVLAMMLGYFRETYQKCRERHEKFSADFPSQDSELEISKGVKS